MSNMLRYFLILLACVATSTALVLDEDLCAGGIEFIAHPNCSLFYHCSNGVPVLLDCPPGYFFNPSLEVCDYPANVPECQGGTRPPTTPAPPTNATTPITTTNATSPTTPTPTNATTLATTTNATSPTTPTPTNATTSATTTNATSPTTPSPSTSTTPAPITETPCNIVLNETSGIIAYKVDSPDTGYWVRCAWTISVPGASKFRFILHQGEFEPDYDGIHVLGLSRDGDEVRRQSIDIADTDVIYELDESIAIILYNTEGSHPSTGFILSYVVETYAEIQFSVNEIGYTNASLGYQFVRGTWAELYENNELSTLLHVANPGAAFASRGRTHFADDCTKDYILTFKWEWKQPNFIWEESDRICDSGSGYIGSTHNDVTLYVFKSNGANVDEGFYLDLSSDY